MNNEIIGYVGSVVIIISLWMDKKKRLHLINLIGTVILLVYSILIKAYPITMLNIFALISNIRGMYKDER